MTSSDFQRALLRNTLFIFVLFIVFVNTSRSSKVFKCLQNLLQTTLEKKKIATADNWDISSLSIDQHSGSNVIQPGAPASPNACPRSRAVPPGAGAPVPRGKVKTIGRSVATVQADVQIIRR